MGNFIYGSELLKTKNTILETLNNWLIENDFEEVHDSSEIYSEDCRETFSDETQELEAIEYIEDIVCGSLDDYEFIHEDYFTEYCKELVTDCGYISQDFPSWIEIDWEETAKNILIDYSEIEYLGETYYYR